MDKRQKLEQKLKENPKNVDFKHIKKLLTNAGYDCINTGGSHFIFRKDHHQSITIPFKRPIKIIYVKRVLALLEKNYD